MRVQEANRLWEVEQYWEQSAHLHAEKVYLSRFPVVVEEPEPYRDPDEDEAIATEYE